MSYFLVKSTGSELESPLIKSTISGGALGLAVRFGFGCEICWLVIAFVLVLGRAIVPSAAAVLAQIGV